MLVAYFCWNIFHCGYRVVLQILTGQNIHTKIINLKVSGPFLMIIQVISILSQNLILKPHLQRFKCKCRTRGYCVSFSNTLLNYFFPAGYPALFPLWLYPLFYHAGTYCPISEDYISNLNCRQNFPCHNIHAFYIHYWPKVKCVARQSVSKIIHVTS